MIIYNLHFRIDAAMHMYFCENEGDVIDQNDVKLLANVCRVWYVIMHTLARTFHFGFDAAPLALTLFPDLLHVYYLVLSI